MDLSSESNISINTVIEKSGRKVIKVFFKQKIFKEMAVSEINMGATKENIYNIYIHTQIIIKLII